MMLKKSLASLPRSLVLALLCAGAMAQASAQTGTSRIGFVYTERLMTESKLAKAADAKLQSEFSKRQKQLDDAVQKYKQSREKFDDEAPKLSDVDRTKRTRELLDMEKDVQRMQREYNEDLFQRKNEERAAIAQKAYKLIEQVAEQDHLDVVLQEAIWTSPRIDITDRILKLLDK
ncbi:OmpH family outer membrane protein [Massilia pinisoli]|jgi:outer membrane protein|uniref:OmpH family outer membrane protein n=1 Tax=Massilia pinisoli TaxID=1772194 RepID=A0ABT1ZL80_9BURK|nr:OmpH family outer membrane protein [Massilia pinisoli]MCS0580673.1 OmpH family outer membrane protein [Massilia pinisoli]